ncbi:MAG: AI-2E family transporter [Kangiellaceae bacterium]|jgi:predicted PurR-regulated permease PerM|nr:AI-2E family transporter [Kangiellaceae bacterium]
MSDLMRWWWLGITLIVASLLYFLSPILTPFFVAATFAYLGDPITDWLESKKLNRTMAVVVVFILFSLVGFLFILMMVPMLKQQVEIVVEKTPVALGFINESLLPWINQLLGNDETSFDFSQVQGQFTQQLKDNSGFLAEVIKSITSSGLAVLVWLGNLVLIPVVTFYLLRDWDFLVAKLFNLFPRKSVPVIKQLTHECDEVLGAFVRGQLIVMIALGMIYAIGLYIVGLDLALLVGMVAGLASVVPYLGFIIGIIFAAVAGLIQFGDPQILIGISIVFAIGQALEGMVLTPTLVGDKIGLHPVAVIFAVLAGGQLFGFVGVLIALPVAAVIMVLLRHIHDRYVNSILYGADTVGEGSLVINPDAALTKAVVDVTNTEQTENSNANDTDRETSGAPHNHDIDSSVDTDSKS